MTDQYIQSKSDLYEHYQHFNRYRKPNQEWCDGAVYVTSRIKKDVQCSDTQGKIIIGGTVYRIAFYNEGAGVWRTVLQNLKGENV